MAFYAHRIIRVNILECDSSGPGSRVSRTKFCDLNLRRNIDLAMKPVLSFHIKERRCSRCQKRCRQRRTHSVPAPRSACANSRGGSNKPEGGAEDNFAFWHSRAQNPPGSDSIFFCLRPSRVRVFQLPYLCHNVQCPLALSSPLPRPVRARRDWGEPGENCKGTRAQVVYALSESNQS